MKKNRRPLSSIFANDIQRYIEHQIGLGRNFRVEICILRAFDAYLDDNNYNGQLTQEIVVNFVYSKPKLMSVQYGRRYTIIRFFSEYRSTLYPDTPKLIPQAVQGKAEQYPAHIYTDDEIAALLNEAKSLRPAGSLRPLTFYTLFGLLISTGIRIGEAIRLDVDDVDLETGVIRILNTKFRKSRLVPVHESTLTVLKDYRSASKVMFPKIDSPSFFLNQRKKRLVYSTVVATFISCARQTGIRAVTGQGPRLHDLRHTFAVNRVLEWYHSDEDVQAKLSELATYMGHAHFEDTTYYLTAGAEIMSIAAKRFERSQQGVCT